jgi:hypothetical protein
MRLFASLQWSSRVLPAPQLLFAGAVALLPPRSVLRRPIWLRLPLVAGAFGTTLAVD